MVNLKKPPFIDQNLQPPLDENGYWTLPWFEWLRDIESTVNSRTIVFGDVTDGNITYVTNETTIVDAGISYGDLVTINDVLQVVNNVSQGYLTENLLPEAGTESGHHLGDRTIEGDLTVDSVETDYIQLDTSYEDGTYEGRLQWNSEDGTLEYGLPGGNVTLQVGQEQLVKCTNKTGADIANGKAVYITGAQGSRPTIGLACSASGAGNVPLGVTTEAISNNESGYVNVGGLVRGMDTSDIPSGDIAFLSDTIPGEFRTTPPDAPNFTTVVGYCLFSNATSGILLVRVLSSPRLISLSDVNHGTPSEGDFLIYVSRNSRWEKRDFRFLTENLLPEAGTESSHHLGLLHVDDGKANSVARSGHIDTESQTVENTAVETIVYEEKIPARYLRKGLSLHATCSGLVSNATAADDFTVSGYVGETLLGSFNPAIGNVTDVDWHCDADITVFNAGKSGEIAWHAHFDIAGSDNTGSNVSTIDTTIDEDFTIRIQWDNAKAGNILRRFVGKSIWTDECQ